MEAQDEKQSTPLYWAACRGHTEMVSFLVFDAKANPSAANIFRSCLHVAAGWGHVGTCKALLKAGANTNAQDNNGQTPADVASLSSDRFPELARVFCADKPSSII